MLEHFGKFCKARAERRIVCFLGILIFFLPAIRVCLIGVGGRKRRGSICAIGVVALRIVFVEVVPFRLNSG